MKRVHRLWKFKQAAGGPSTGAVHVGDAAQELPGKGFGQGLVQARGRVAQQVPQVPHAQLQHQRAPPALPPACTLWLQPRRAPHEPDDSYDDTQRWYAVVQEARQGLRGSELTSPQCSGPAPAGPPLLCRMHA